MNSMTCVDISRVEQELHAGVRATLQKERWKLGDLTLVRKHTAFSRALGRGASAAPLAAPLSLDRPHVVLVHGFAQNRYSWHSTRRSVSAWLASEGFDVWNLELRGHGTSKARGAPEEFADYVEDAVTFASALGVPAFWVGHSLGGAVAYAAATRVPMRGVIGIGALFRFAQSNRMLNLLCRMSAMGRGREILGGLNVRTRLAGQLLGRLYSISDIAGYAFPISGWAPGTIEPDILAERLERGFDWTSLHVWLDMARWGASGRFDYETDWQRVVVPLLVIAGDLDHLMLPEDARVAYDLAGGADRTLVILDDYTTGGHWGHLDLIVGKEAPTHVWPLLRDWMRARA